MWSSSFCCLLATLTPCQLYHCILVTLLHHHISWNWAASCFSGRRLHCAFILPSTSCNQSWAVPVVVGFWATATARTKTIHASTDVSMHLCNGICVSVSEYSTKMRGHRDWNSSWKTTSGLSWTVATLLALTQHSVVTHAILWHPIMVSSSCSVSLCFPRWCVLFRHMYDPRTLSTKIVRWLSRLCSASFSPNKCRCRMQAVCFWLDV